ALALHGALPICRSSATRHVHVPRPVPPRRVTVAGAGEPDAGRVAGHDRRSCRRLPPERTEAPDRAIARTRVPPDGESPAPRGRGAGLWSEVAPGSALLGLAAVAGPLGVEDALAVHAVVGVGAEEVALALDQGGGQALGAHGVVVGQRRREPGHRDAVGDGVGDGRPPPLLALL